MIVTTIEIVRNVGSIGENIRILTLAIGVIAIFHIVVEGYLMVALVVAHKEVGVVEGSPHSLHHVKSGSITGIKGLGLDIDKCAHIGIACRWSRVIFHILDFIHGYALEVIVGSLNTIDKYLQRLAVHGLQFARKHVIAQSRQCGEYLLSLAGVLLLFLREGEYRAVNLVHTVVSLHKYSIYGILLALHLYRTNIGYIHDGIDVFVAYT